MTAVAAAVVARRYGTGDPVHGEVVDFLVDEAALLDDDRYHDWLGLLAPDVEYLIPTRKTVSRKLGRGHDELDAHMADNLFGLTMKVQRSADIASAWDRDPAPHTRRIVGNVVVREGARPDELAVASSFVAVLNRFSTATSELLSGRRADVLRRTDDGLRLVRRTVLVDQGMISVAWINVFL